MPKKKLIPISGQRTLFGGIISTTPTWKCGAPFSQENPIYKITQSSSLYNLFCNAHARTLNHINISLKDARSICDDQWKLQKENETALLELSRQQQPTELLEPTAAQPTAYPSYVVSDCKLSLSPLVPVSARKKCTAEIESLCKLLQLNCSDADHSEVFSNSPEDKAFLSLIDKFCSAVSEFFGLLSNYPSPHRARVTALRTNITKMSEDITRFETDASAVVQVFLDRYQEFKVYHKVGKLKVYFCPQQLS